MATLIYLPSSGSPDVTPSTWIFPNQINPVTYKAAKTKAGTAMSTKTEATGTTNPTTRAMVRYVIGPLIAQSISGTVRAVLRCRESNTGANATLAIACKIIQPGGSDRATLLGVTASDSAANPYEFTTTLGTRRAWTASETEPLSLTTQSATAGDYLVIELGFRSATATSRTIDLRLGDEAANNCPYSDGDTNDYNGWVEFSGDIALIYEESVSLARTEGIAIAEEVISAETNETAQANRALSIAAAPQLEASPTSTIAVEQSIDVVGSWVVDETLYDPAPAPPMSLLVVSTTNPRYLETEQGEPVYLAGFHTWYNVQDGGGSDPPSAFDWDEYLTALISYGCNFTKLWASLETAQLWADPLDSGFNPQYFNPPRYARTGPGLANDDKLKFDLTQINSTFMSRLRARAVECAQNGIYCAVQLFQGWQIDTKGGTINPWTFHPYREENNINSLDGDFNDDGLGTETHMSGTDALPYQEDLVEAIIDLLNDLDNIIWEISNEDTGSVGNTTWQEYIIDHITAYEATKPKQHLIMRTVCYPNGDNNALDASDASVVSYNASKADSVLDGTKVAMRDSDHIEGIATDYNWVWPALCNGSGGVWYMDEWDGALYGTDRRSNSTYMTIRSNLGYANTLVNLFNNFLLMTPQPSLSTSGYCLARNHATAGEYVCYYDGSSTFNLNLSTATGTLNIRWLRCSDGTVQDSATVQGGDVRTLTPPWTGRVVAYVRHI